MLLLFSLIEARPEPDHTGSGIDFSKAVDDPETGLQCVTNEATVDTLEREKLLECVYTYVTRFRNQRVEECKDHYEKICNIAYHQVYISPT